MTTSATHHGQYWNQQDEELTHEARHMLRTTVLDLDAFRALDEAARAARWQQWSVATKTQFVQLVQTELYGQWYADEIANGIARFEQRWGNDLPQPGTALLDETAAELARIAQFCDDRAAARALNKAALVLADGGRARLVAGDWLVASATTRGAVHRLTGQGCSCEAGRRGRACWHAALVEITTVALERAAAAADHGGADEQQTTPARVLGQRLSAARRRCAA